MKIKVLKKVTLFVFSFFLFLSCSNMGGNDSSRTTGWKYNDKNSTGFEFDKAQKIGALPGLTFIPGGSFTIGEKTEFVTAPRNNERRKVSVSPFYMDKYEVRNIDWREYTHWMNLVFGKVAPSLVKKVQPNDEVWREELAYNEPYLQFYSSHPAFDQYPVVGVSWEQAMDYCVWRTDRINELSLINAGILEHPDFVSLDGVSFEIITKEFIFNTQKYLMQQSYNPIEGPKQKQDLFNLPRKVAMKDGLLIPNLRLPTEAEWEYAAYAIKEGDEGFAPEGKLYPWSGSHLRETKGKKKGFQANFVRGRGDYMGLSNDAKSGTVITVPVDSYYPNDFGLYNMAGNVNEWVMDVYRSTSFDDVSEYNSFRGNVYLEPVVLNENILGGTEYQIDSLGRIQYKTQKGGDLRSFKDGDVFTMFSGVSADLDYLQEKEGLILDPTDVLTNKITDKTRVYKGGSWKDRSFWLNPSTRRYLDEDKSANDIGFRCAMSAVGQVPKK